MKEIKKILIILAIATTFFIFQIALMRYDIYIEQKFFDFNPGEYLYEITMSGEINPNEIVDFQENFERLLDENNLYCYQKLYLNHGRPELFVWAYTEDPYYFNNIFLTSGELSAIELGDFYYSNDEKNKGTIYNAIKNKDYKIYHLSDFSSKHKSIFNPYFLYSYDTDIEVRYYTFTSELKYLYPDLIITPAKLHYHRVEIDTINKHYLIFAILTGILMIISLNTSILKQTKKIKILKLEGYGSWQIYRKYVLNNIALVLVTIFLTNVLMYLINVETSFKNARLLLLLLMTPIIALIISLFILSLFAFVSILFVNPNLAIKGKNSLLKQKNLNYIVMILLIVFATGTLLEGADYFIKYLRIITTESKYLNGIENLYQGAHIKPEYIAYQDVGIDGAQLMNDYLRLENNMFELMMYEKVRIGKKEIIVFKATENYVRQYILEDLGNEKREEPYILLPENLSHMSEQIYQALDNVRYRGYGSMGGTVTYPKKKVTVIDPYQYIHSGLVLTDVVFIISESLGITLTLNSYFSFMGNEDEAQAFYDRLSVKFDTLPISTIVPIKDFYEYYKANFNKGFIYFSPIFFLTLLTIMANSYHIALLNSEIHDKRYAILKSEGKSILALLWNELKLCFIILLFSEVILLRFMGMDLRELLIIISIYFVIHTLILWCATNYQMRNFAERLR